MTQPTFPPHPHAGFSAVTYMFEDAVTGFRNRDSRGNDSLIEPGALHWTLAGAGIVHEEVPIEPGKVAHGLQIFVNLPAHAKQMTPTAFHVSAKDIPTWRTDGVYVRLAFGQWHAPDGTVLQAPFKVPVDANLLDVTVAANHTFTSMLAPEHRVAIHVIRGEVEIAGEQLDELGLAILTAGGQLRVTALTDNAQFVLLYGTPLAEPMATRGPFIMNTQAQIAAAIERYRSGAMERLEPMGHYSR